MSVVDNSDVFSLVTEEVSEPGVSPGVVLGVVVSDNLVSLAFQLGDESRDISDNSVCAAKHEYNHSGITTTFMALCHPAMLMTYLRCWFIVGNF